MEQKQLTCAQRVDSAWDNVRETIRLMLDPQESDVELVDDGTLDTILKLDDREYRFSDSSDYRDDNGNLDLESFISDNWDDMRDEAYEAFSEYGLSFDYVEPNTFNDQNEGYFRYQICYGGPSEELRFYVNIDYSFHKIEFWFLDWFDGAHLDVTCDEVAQMVWQQFQEYAPSLIE